MYNGRRWEEMLVFDDSGDGAKWDVTAYKHHTVHGTDG